jgi:uncharacterized GH25 family protein
MLWLLVGNDTPQVGERVPVEIGWGHKFPRDEEIKAERLGSIQAVGPDGQALALKKISTTRYEFVPPTKGVYLISAQVAPDFLTKTPDGFKLQSKKGIPEAVSCFRFDMAGKILVNVGRQRQGFDRRAQSALEIIPLKNPNTLKTGAMLAVKVIFEGAPLAGAEIKYTHENCPDPKKSFATLTSDRQGEVRLKLDKPGKWLLVASHKTPYYPPEECDEHFYSASLTFSVR